MASLNSDQVSDIIIECTEEYILPRYKALADHEVSTKTGPTDLVTQADLDVEAHLIRVLPNILPGSVVVGEEGVSSGDASLDALQDSTQKVWVVDPIDGTRNFVNSNPDFGVMIALVIDGETQYGWIYDVLEQRMHVAEKGAGAYVNGDKLQVRETDNIADMVAHINHRYFPEALRPEIKSVVERFKTSVSVGSAAHEYTRIAAGKADISLYSRLKPWDHLPGALLVEEAGGYVGKWDKKPYTAQDDYAGLIVAANRENWDAVYDLVFGNIDLSKYI